MKKIVKSLLLTLLVAAMLLNTCGIVLADNTATLTVTQELVDETAGVYKLVFSLTSAADAQVDKTHTVFSYDNTVIQPVNRKSSTGYADVTITESVKGGSKDPLRAYNNTEDEVSFTLSAPWWMVNGTRTAISADTYNNSDSVNTKLGMVFLEFYFKYKDASKANSETFKLETDYSEGSFLKTMYPDPTEKSASAVVVGDFAYGTASADDTETIAAPTFTYTGSDKLVLKELAITPSAESVDVPVTYPVSEADKTVTFTATATSTIGTSMTVSTSAVWSVEGTLPTGVTFDAATKTLTVAKNAAAGTATIKIADGDISDTATVTIVKAAEVATVIEAKANGEVFEDAVTVVKPVTEGSKSVAFTAKVFDQYGGEVIDAPVAFSVSEADLKAGVTFENNTLSVTKDAPDCNINAKAAYGELELEFAINVVGLEVDWTPVENAFASTIKYGMTNAEINTVTDTIGTASVDGRTITGKFAVINPTDKQDAGSALIVVAFTTDNTEANGEYANIVINEDFDITIAKADYDMSKITAAPQISTYTGSAIDYADANVAKPEDVEIVNKVYSAEPVNADEYTVTISFETSNTNYNNPVDVTADLTINKAVATSFVTEAPVINTNAKLYDGTTLADTKANLIETATVNYGAGLTAEVEMTWADPTQAFDPKGGTYTFVGTPANDNLDLGSLTLTTTLNITPVTGTLTTALNNITVAQAALAAADGYDDIKFPTSIEVTYEGDAEATVINDLTWTKTLDELKSVAVGSSVTVGLAADTFPAWATISGASDITFTVTDKLPVDVTVNMAATGVYGTAMEAATASQVDAGDGIDESGTAQFDYVYTGTTLNGAAYNSDEVPTEAGNYTVTATLVSSTHAGSTIAEFAINPLAITATVVVGNEGTRKYSDANPEFSYTAEVIGEDDLDVTYTCTANETTPVGTTVPVTAVAGNKNYTVEWTNGALEIVAKPLSETAFVPVIGGATDRGAQLTLTVEGLTAEDYTIEWSNGAQGNESTTSTYTLNWADSNKNITVTITGIGNYTGTKTSEATVIPKYAMEGTMGFNVTNGAESDAAKLDIGDTVELDVSTIDPAYAFDELGASATIAWYAGETVIENANDWSYTLVLGNAGVLKAVVTVGGEFTGEYEVVVGEIGKEPLEGTITITPNAGEDTILEAGETISAVASLGEATADDYDLKWFIDETQLTLNEDGTYTVTEADYAKTVTVKAIAKGDVYTGEVVATYSIPAIAPSDVTISTSKTAASITATLAAKANGAAISSFSLTITDGAEFTQTVTVTADENGAFVHTFAELTTGTTYTLTANATNAAGTSTPDATATATPASTSRPRPNPTPVTPVEPTPDTDDDEGATTEPEVKPEVTVKVEDTSAEIGANIIKDNDAVAVTTKTESGTEVKTTVNVADAEVAKLEVSTTDSNKAAAGAAAEGAVGTPVEVKVEAKDAKGNAAEVTVDVAIPSDEKAYAYIVDENGVATRTESVYNEETGEVEVANVPDGAVVMISTTAPATFDDAADHWAEETINYAVDAGIMNGVGGGAFDPNGDATRGMVNAMMVRLAKVTGAELAEAADHKVDTDAAHWAAATDLIALANGWTTGVRTLEDGTVVMDTDRAVTREQLVTMLWRFVEHPEAKGNIESFDDHHETSDWAKEAKAWAVGAGIINGKPGNILDPNGTATRAEIATMFQRLMEYMTK